MKKRKVEQDSQNEYPDYKPFMGLTYKEIDQALSLKIVQLLIFVIIKQKLLPKHLIYDFILVQLEYIISTDIRTMS